MENECKFVLCVLLTQFGKTFTAINRIITEIDNDKEFGRSVHVIFTINTLLNNKQFANRLKVIEDTHGVGSVCVFTSKYEGSFMHVRNILHLKGICLDEATCPRVIVMCSNTRRYSDGHQFLEVIDKNKTNIARAFAYYDELHNYISEHLRQQIEKINDLDIVKCIVALSATPDQIWRNHGFWSKIRLFRLEQYNDENYVGFNDMNFHCIDDFFDDPYVRPKALDFDQLDAQMIGFVKHVLDKYPEILNDKTRTFIPAHHRRIGHNAIRDLIKKQNSKCVVIMINGIEKTIEYDEYKIPLYSTNEEVSETIERNIFAHGLSERPIVITGFLCVGMGQTLMNKKLGSFTSAILGHLDLSNDAIYQLFGRITGRMKHWESYEKTHVFCPTITMHRCQVMEECAKNMAIEHNGDIVTRDDYREPMTKMGDIGLSAVDNFQKAKEMKHRKKVKDIIEHRVFDLQEEARSFAHDNLGVNLSFRKSASAPKDLLQKDGSNPTVQQLVNRSWGINDHSRVRMTITNENKWCLYWKTPK